MNCPYCRVLLQPVSARAHVLGCHLSAMTYDDNMDQECIPLCDALNLLDGIETFESCCGHGSSPFSVYFSAQTVDELKPLMKAIYEMYNWTVRVGWASGGDGMYFVLVGPVGAYEQANSLATALIEVTEGSQG